MGRHVELTHRAPVEIPALLETPNAIVDVHLVVLVASLVAKPDLVALVEKAGSECVPPIIRASAATMMEVHGVLCGVFRLFELALAVLTGDADDRDQPAIFGLDLVGFPVVAPGGCGFGPCWVVSFVRLLGCHHP